MDVVAPGCDHKSPEASGPQNPTSSGSPVSDLGSKSALESRRAIGDPDATQPLDGQEILVEDLGSDSEEDMQDLRENLPPEDLTGQITVQRPAPTPVTCNTTQPGPMLPESQQLQDTEEYLSALGTSNLIEDAKFYQDAAIKISECL